MMGLDILIPTYNRSTLLGECLESVLRSTSLADWRVTVIDNNSKDDTRQVVESFAARSDRVRYLFEKTQGKSAALNSGIKASDSDVIGMIDDDEQLHPEWVGIVAKWMEDPRIDYIGGPYLGLWRTEKPEWIPAGYEGVLSADDPAHIPGSPLRFPDARVFLRGGNAVMRRSVFDRIGGYRTDIGRFGNDLGSCEDHEIYTRLLAVGLTGYYVPDLIIYHVVPPERVTREYYRKWAKGQAESLGLLDRANPQKVPYVGRVPRYMIGDAVKALPALSSSDRGRRFAAELRWWTLAGFVNGAYRKAPPVNGNH
jgi:glycosyltransferase involved in cell wall biosynthesis